MNKVLLILGTLLVSFNTFSQQVVQKKIIVKFKQSVNYKIDYSQNKIELINGLADKVFTKNNLYKITSLLGKSQKASQNLKSSELIKNIHFLQFNTTRPISEIISELNSTNMFEYVEEDFAGNGGGVSSIIPNDTYFNRQWGLLNNGTFNPQAKPGADVKMTDAWSVTTGDSSTIVCVLDAGAKLDHPEFGGRIWVNPGEVANNGIDDDGNGYVDDTNGWDFVNNDKNPSDDHGHGTNVAGIIGANANNSTGYAGVNWNCKLMIGKILDSTNSGFYSWWTSGIYYAVANGAKIINMSEGGVSFSQSMKDACDFAYNNNVTIVACTMNSNNNVTYYPAGYSSTIAVGATTVNDFRASPFAWGGGSNYGAHIDVVAPGNFIYGLSYNSNTNYNTYWSGTSQATPLVAGIVSLMYGLKPSLTVSTVRSVLITTAQDMVGNPAEDVPGFDQYMGYGRVNASEALNLLSRLTTITFSGKVYLQGAYNTGTGTMNNTLNSSGILQTNALLQPYNNTAFNYLGTERIGAGFFTAHPDIVDWVLLELRDKNKPSTIVASRAAFVKQDGTLTDTNGTSAQILFSDVATDNYFVGIRHRNHLGTRSSASIDFSTGAAAYDFTTGSDKAFQNQSYTSMVQIGDVWAMRGGNANANNNVKYNGPANDQNEILNVRLSGSLSDILSNIYSAQDINMDGAVKWNGPGNDQNFLLNIILGGSLSMVVNEQL